MGREECFAHIKVWSYFFLALLIGAVLLLATGWFWLLGQLVRILAYIFRRKELDQLVKGFSRFYLCVENDIRGRPEQIVNVLFVLEGELDLDYLQTVLYDRILFKKDQNGDLIYKKCLQFPTTWLYYDFLQWEKDFKISSHVKNADHNLTSTTLHEFIATRSKMPFENNTSMWELVVAKNFDGQGNTGLYFRCQHSLSDGMSLIKLFYSEMSPGNAVGINEPSPTGPQRPAEASNSVVTKLSVWRNIYKNYICVPRQFVLERSEHWNLPRNSDYSKTGQIFVETIIGICLDDLKRAKTKLETSLTVLIVSAVSSALSVFLEGEFKAEGVKPNRITTTITFPLPTTPKEKLTNHFGVAEFNIPVDVTLDQATRMSIIEKELQKIPFLASTRILAVLNAFLQHFPTFLLKKLVQLLRSRNVFYGGVTLTNVPGPSQRTSFLDYPVQDMMFWFPATPDFSLVFAIFSYKGELKVGVSGSKQLVGNNINMKRICSTVEAELTKFISENQ